MKNATKQVALVLLWMAVISLVSAQTTETSQNRQPPSAAWQNPSAPNSSPQTAPGQPPPAQQTPPQASPSPTVPAQTTPETPLPQTQPQQQPPPATPPSPPYKPKFSGDPARSESESQALGYMRVVLRAEQLYKKRHDKYAESLTDLAGTGSFTRRMAKSTERGDYTVGFRPRKDGFILVMTPKQLDPEHRSFYAEEDAIIHADDQKPADATSPRIK
jgi:type IV secretory pathway VirB10-like protein